MRAKVVAVHSNKLIVQAFIAALLAFVFSTYANAAQLKSVPLKKHKPKSVMFLNSKNQKLLAQNSANAAADAKLEGTFMSDSIPVAAPVENHLAKSVTPLTKVKKVWEPAAALNIETSTGINSAEKKSYSGEYTFIPSLKHNPSKLSAAAKIIYGREYTEQKDDNTDGDLSPISIALRKAVETKGLVDGIHFGPNFTIPAGNEARRQTLNGALGLMVGATKKIGILSLKQEVGYSYRFYRYDIRDDGTVNSPHSIASSSSAGLEFNKWFGLSAEFVAQQLINFQGTPTGNTSAAVEADFTVSKNASVALGLATSLAGTLSNDGQTRRILLYDPGVTSVFLSLGLSI